jgi:hypothetical protein
MSVHHNEHGAAGVVVTTHGGSDMRAAFTGLIVGVFALLAVVVTIVMLTNRAFEGHGEAPASGAPAATAPGTPH